MATTFYIDNVLGNDSYDGLAATVGSGHGPWKTFYHASLSASYNAASTPWTIEVKDNGWAYPYLEASQAAIIYPDFSGSAVSPVTWNFNFAPMIPATELTGKTWTLMPGTSNVYFAGSVSETLTQGLYGWSSNPADDLMYGNGRHYHASLLEAVAYIPNDWEDHCYYHDTTNQILYWCDRSGPPSLTNARFAYRGTVYGCFNTFRTLMRQYHYFNNMHWYGGRYDANNGYCFASGQTNYYGYNRFNRGYCLYGGPGHMAILGPGDRVNYCLFADHEIARANFAGIRVTGHSGATDNVKIYNSTIFRGTPRAFYFYDYGNLELKNSAIIDSPILAYNAGTHQVFTETNNFYGVTEMGSVAQTQLVITPDATDIWEEGSSGYSMAEFTTRDTNVLNLRPAAASSVLNSGTWLDLTADLLGNTVFPDRPDIGAYEMFYRRRHNSIEMEVDGHGLLRSSRY